MGRAIWLEQVEGELVGPVDEAKVEPVTASMARWDGERWVVSLGEWVLLIRALAWPEPGEWN